MYSIVHFDTLDSTNDECKRNYRAYRNQSVIVTKTQTKGRGRFDRVWESEKDLTFSILYKENKPSLLIFPLAIVYTLQSHGINAMIKWPNDILIDGKKVCGMLMETMYEGTKQNAFIVGIGINLSKKSEVLATKSTYLTMDASMLLQEILNTIDHLMEMQPEDLLQQYQQYHYLYKKEIVLNNQHYLVGNVQLDGSLTVFLGDASFTLYGEEVTLESIYQPSSTTGSR